MEKDRALHEVFNKFLKNECSTQELNLIFEYLQLNNSRKDEDIKKIIEEELEKLSASELMIDKNVSNEIYSNIEKFIEREKNVYIPPAGNSGKYKNYYSKIAAGLVIIFVSSLLLYNLFFYNKQVIIKSKYGQTVSVILPDKSSVILNGNTTLTYEKEWDAQHPRQVWLQGEAYFSVKHTKDNQKFFVIADNMKIEVLGTEFNVFSRRQSTKVVLNSGKVKVDIASHKKDKQVVYMKPGELVEFEKKSEELTKRMVDPAMYSSWKDKKLILNNTSLEEIAILIEDTYGYQVIYGDSVRLDRKLSGTIPNDDVHVLINALSYYGIEIKKIETTTKNEK